MGAVVLDCQLCVLVLCAGFPDWTEGMIPPNVRRVLWWGSAFAAALLAAQVWGWLEGWAW